MQFPAQRVVEPAIVNFFGMQYVIPRVVERGGSVLAVNVGGAVIPVLVALHLIRQRGITRRLLLSSGVVTVLMYHLAQPIPGVGIALPPLLPSVATAVIALVLDRRAAPSTAFIAGTLGTLVGADLLNLGRIRDLGAPVASIGGAGTFDGVFMIGIVAVLLAGLPGSRARHLRVRRPHGDGVINQADRQFGVSPAAAPGPACGTRAHDLSCGQTARCRRKVGGPMWHEWSLRAKIVGVTVGWRCPSWR